MTNAILRKETHAGNPHGRVDDGETASAKPRRGALLYSKVIGHRISPFAAALFSFVFSLSAHAAAPTLSSPANGATVALQNAMRVEIFASPIPKGMEGNPFQIGEEVFAYTNTEGVLMITGTGAMSNFVSAADVPWAPETVKKVAVDVSKIQIGVNSLSALADGTLINETLVSNIRPYVPGFTSTPVQPAGAISPAEFERVSIVDGVALLDVSVYTSDALTNENWSVATNGVIEVPAPGKQGFFILKSKPAK